MTYHQLQELVLRQNDIHESLPGGQATKCDKKFKLKSYAGYWKDDLKHGYGRQQYVDGWFYKGNFESDCRHGYGKISRYNLDGTYSFYEGLWANDEQNGLGFSGCVTKQSRIAREPLHGNVGNSKTNKACREKGWTYEGEMLNGLKHGMGKYIFDDRDGHFHSYEGDWIMDKENGQGKYAWNDGSTYEGAWEMGIRCGKGIYRNELGDVYDGYWQNDRYHGAGVLTNAVCEETKEGEWCNGSLFNGIVLNLTKKASKAYPDCYYHFSTP